MQQFAPRQDPWSKTLEIMSEGLNKNSFNTWFLPLRVLEISGGRMVLTHEDRFALDTLRKRYAILLENAVRQAYGEDYELIFVDPGAPIPPAPVSVESQLNPKYTFDTFVVGASNRFAHAASLAVAEVPSDAYNPLFLYGGVGLGKTHLMHAIGHYILEEDPSKRLLYITSERFTNEVIESITNKTTQEMRERLRGVDVLMVDDIQFIAGKTATQEEFFHTFNHLHSSGKQIVISSDRPPRDIPTLEERLRSRFEWGLIADIQKPDYETRIAILRKKAESERTRVDEKVIEFIAENVQSNIRELEGSLTRVIAQAMLTGRPVTLESAQESLSGILGEQNARKVSPEAIMQVVADYYHLEKGDLTSQRRNREIALPRQVAMYLIRELMGLSTTRIGECFGGRDHTTVMHAIGKIEKGVKDSAQLSGAVSELRNLITKR